VRRERDDLAGICDARLSALRAAEKTCEQLRGAMQAQDERELRAAAACGVPYEQHGCDWPDAVADAVLALRSALDAERACVKVLEEAAQAIIDDTNPPAYRGVAAFDCGLDVGRTWAADALRAAIAPPASPSDDTQAAGTECDTCEKPAAHVDVNAAGFTFPCCGSGGCCYATRAGCTTRALAHGKEAGRGE
jgi:hypothetical protein